MISYKDARKLYDSIAKPPRSPYWRHSLPDLAKPLKGTGQRHKSIHMLPSGGIYFRLYQTNVATFIPNDDNTYTVIMRYHSSPTTQRFMHEFGLHYAFQKTDRDYHAHIPYIHCSSKDFASAVLTYHADTDQLITDPLRSWHPVVATMVSSDEDKRERAKVRALIKPALTLAAFTVDTHREFALQNADQSYAAPFFSVERWLFPRSNSARAFTNFVRSRRIGPAFGHGAADVTENLVNNEEFFDKFSQAVPAFLTLYVSKIADKEFEDRWKRNGTRPSWAPCVEHALDHLDIDKFSKSLERQLLSCIGVSEGTEKKPVPQFVSKLPRRFYHYDYTCPDLFVNKFSSRVYGLN